MSAKERSGFEPLPPAVTRGAATAATEPGETLLPPFFAGGPEPAAATEPPMVELADLAPDPVPEPAGPVDEAFPLDAFIVPDDAKRVPAGFDAGPIGDPASELAAKLERLASQLREGGIERVDALAATGDRLDAVLAGVLSGYLAGRNA